MPAYYNENDPFAAQWLRNLISAGHIAPGDIDARSIVDVKADDLEGYEQAHFFAGIGGWSRALRLAGWADNRPVWTGSCPCQPFSAAGALERFTDERHLWPTWVRLIEQRSPATILGEQVAGATEWLRLVRGDLEALGYAVGAIPIEAASAGADHLRDRFWFVGDYQGERRGEGRPEYEIRRGRDAAPGAGRAIDLADADQQRFQTGEQCGSRGIYPARIEGAGHGEAPAGASGDDLADCDGARTLAYAPAGPPWRATGERSEWVIGADGKARRVKPGVRLLAHGIPNRVGKLRGLGNAIDPRPAAKFIGAFMECQP